MPRLLLVRHGRTNLQKEDRYWGNTDIPLNDLGIIQAKQVRDRLEPEKVTHVYASNLSRARETAKIIAAAFHKEVAECEELREFNFGYAEGLTYDEMKKLHPELADELGKMGNVKFPAGESLDGFFERVKPFVKRLEKHKPPDVIVIVAHGGSLRMLICHLLGLELKHWYRFRLDPASISVVDMYPSVCILNSLNEIDHLAPVDL